MREEDKVSRVTGKRGKENCESEIETGEKREQRVTVRETRKT